MGRDKTTGLYLVHKQPQIDIHQVGLVNLGNSCFYNSIVQCLSATTALSQAIDCPPSSSPSLLALAPTTATHEPLSPLPVTEAFLALIRRLSAPPLSDEAAQRKARTHNPRLLLREMSLKHEEYGETTQQDAHELLRHLMDSIEMEEVDLIKKVLPPVPVAPIRLPKQLRRSTLLDTRPSLSTTPTPSSWKIDRAAGVDALPSSSDDDDDDDKDEEASSASESDSSDSDSSSDSDTSKRRKKKQDGERKSDFKPFIASLFAGKLTSVIVCEYSHVSLIEEDFLDLSLSIKNEAQTKVRRRDRIRKTLQTSFFSSQKPSMSEAEASPSASEAEEDESGNRKGSSSLGRRKSLASLADGGRRSFWSRGDGIKSTSASRDPSPSALEGRRTAPTRPQARIPKPTPEQQAYVKTLLAEVGTPISPLLHLRWALPPHSTSSAGSASTSGSTSTKSKASSSSSSTATSSSTHSSSTSGAAASPTATTDLHECLRQFTAVETLEAENMFACKKCWKLLNPKVVKQQKETKTKAKKRRDRSNTMRAPTVSLKDVEGVSDGGSFADEMELVEPMLALDVSSNTLALPVVDPGMSSPMSETVSLPSSGGNFGDLSDDDGSITDSSSDSLPVDRIPTQGTGPLTTANVLALSSSASSIISMAKGKGANSIATSTATKAAVAFDSCVKLPPRISRHILRTAQKRYLISPTQLPPVLVIHFKRFQQTKASSLFGSSFSNLRKIDTPLSFPLELDLTPYLAPLEKKPRRSASSASSPPRRPSLIPSVHLPSPLYRLYGVVEHIGSLGTGHYSCYFLSDRYRTKMGDDFGGDEADRPTSPRRWFHASDEVVRVCDVQEVLKSKAYMLFYERIDSDSTDETASRKSNL